MDIESQKRRDALFFSSRDLFRGAGLFLTAVFGASSFRVTPLFV
jgi:hypothetical protein